MRQHLLNALTRDIRNHFKKKKRQNKKETKQIKVVNIDMELLCCCSFPDVMILGPWIACDQWYLKKCEGINGKEIP